MHLISVWLLIITISMPWTPEAAQTLRQFGIELHDAPCYLNGNEFSGWIGADNRIHLCPGEKCTRPDLLLLHESQHLFARLYFGDLTSQQWDGFDTLALRILYARGYDEGVILQASTVSGWNQPGELHAELPLIIGYDMPPELQPWYVWFDLNSAPASPPAPSDEASRPLGHLRQELK